MGTTSFQYFELKGDNLTNNALKQIEISIGPTAIAYNAIMKEVEKIANRIKFFSSIYIEGLYGSGKTLVLRKAVYDIISGSKKESFKNIIPLYFFLGETNFLPMSATEEYLAKLKSYIEGEIEGPATIGEKGDWKERVEVLERCIDTVKNRIGKIEPRDEPKIFIEVLKELNKNKYYPLVVFDEFERVIYTGEGLKTDGARMAFSEFCKMYLELTRGHLFLGIFVLASTKPILDLLIEAYKEGKPHIKDIAQYLAIPEDSLVKDFPMTRLHIVYDFKYNLLWSERELENLTKNTNINFDGRLLKVISLVLPMPRIVLQIGRLISLTSELSKEKISIDILYPIIESKIKQLIDRLKKEYLKNGRPRPIVPPRTKWLERFENLLQNGYYYISTRDQDVKQIADVLGLKVKEAQRESQTTEGEIAQKKPKDVKTILKQKIAEIIHKLYEVNLYERIGPGEYIINPSIFAFALDIDRLPDGSIANLDTLIDKIKLKIKEDRESKRRYKGKEKYSEQK
jgi:hypothetical protein